MSDRKPHLEKVPTGIAGFDEITGGGIPRNRTTLLAGGPGTGKTIFALQTLVNGARQYGEAGIFVSCEESSRRIVANAVTFGWDLPTLEDRKLFFLDAQIPPEMVQAGQFDLNGILAGLKAKAKEIDAKRIVFDSIDVLLGFLDDPRAERRELYRLHHWLAETGLTGLITSKLDETRSNMPDRIDLGYYGFLQFMADCAIQLSHTVQDHASLRHLRVVKYRGSTFSENEAPLVIAPNGIEVASFGQLDFDYPAFTERISTGVERLDRMLSGDHYRGSSTLITGAPGTAKTTLCGAFADAACKRGEQVLYVSFDESANEIVRNLASVGIQLAAHRERGLLHMYAARSEARSAEEQLLRIRALVDETAPQCLVIDPLSAILKAGGHLEARQVAQRLLYQTKTKGISTLCTSLLENSGANDVEASSLQISTIADTWIHLSYVVQGGERNRALSIVKARGTRHSNQVRELLLSNRGVTLADVYTAGGEVLMGTLRWEKEEAEEQRRAEMRREMAHRQREIQAMERETQARIEALQSELALRQSEVARLAEEQIAQRSQWQDSERKRRWLRSLEAEQTGDGEK